MMCAKFMTGRILLYGKKSVTNITVKEMERKWSAFLYQFGLIWRETKKGFRRKC
jgi:hypothetical protein